MFGILVLLALPSSPGLTAAAPVFLQDEQKPPAPESAPPDATQEQKEEKQEPPPAATEPPPVEPAPDSTKPSEASAPTATQTPEKKPAPAKHRVRRKSKKRSSKPPAAPAASGNSKVVVKNGGATDPKIELAPGMGKQQASQQQQDTNRLLATADANLKKLAGRQLGSSQQATVKQVKTYMQQAKSAADQGDVQGAHNLALKASLLSEELTKP